MTRRGAARVELPAGFWSEPATMAALRARDFGRLLDLVKRRSGASQTRIGIEIDMAQGQVSEIIAGRRQVDTLAVIERIADGLRMPDHARLVLLAPMIARGGEEETEAVKRRDFLVGSSMALAMSATPLFGSVGKIGASDVARIRTELAGLYALDDAVGGSAAFTRAMDQAQAVRHLIDHATYGPTVGRDLQILAGELTEMAGWSAFDIGRHGQARHLFGEALTLAHVTESAALSTLVMASMSLQSTSLGAGREAVALAESAQRTARPFGTARLLSLLAAREALGHARCGDLPAASVALARSETLLDDADDPGQDWLAFWGPADFAGAVAGVHLRVGQTDVAERAVRDAIDATPQRYTRNRVGYRAQLAEVLAVRGEVVEAASVATEVAASGVGSGRVTARLRDLAPILEPHAGEPGVDECLNRIAAL
jgi:hypothetical protein